MSFPADGPPPPYSETDIYSQRGGLSPNDASSNSSTTIYTPPETPRLPHLQPTDASQPPSDPSAVSYFESRPPPAFGRLDLVLHPLAVTPSSRPDDFPFPDGWAPRDVTHRDWLTFLNFLIPHHDVLSNSAVIDRKLRTEVDGRTARGGAERSHAEAQLEQLRPEQLEVGHHELERTVAEWNNAFFGPRGITIRLSPGSRPPAPRMPGAWDEAFDRGSEADRRDDDPGRPSTVPRGLSFGPLTLNQNGIYYNNEPVADRSGVNWGGFRAQGSSHYPPFPPLFMGPGWGGRGRGRGRGRGCGRDPGRRARSPSISSSSSSGSDSSIGSLPDYDELGASELPVFHSRVQEWLGQPGVIRSKEDIRKLKADLAESRRRSSGVQRADKQALKQQARRLAQEWKALKRQQRQEKRQRRRQARQRRKEERRERRSRRREGRRDGPGPGAFPSPGPGFFSWGPHHAGPPAMPAAAPPNLHFPLGMPPMPPPNVPPFNPQPGFGSIPPVGLSNVPGGGRPIPRSSEAGGFPGAWPADDDDDQAPHHASSAIYREANSLQEQIDSKRKARDGHSYGPRPRCGGPSRRRGWPGEANATQLDAEIDALEKTVKELRVRGDEEYAREIAMAES